MPAVQYPFIDIAVHESVRDHFTAGEAVVLFSPNMQAPLWANGVGASLFGFPSIYDFLDQGPNRLDVAFRQIEAAARQLSAKGDVRHVTIRVTSGFQRLAIQARCELIEVQGEATVLFTAAVETKQLSDAARAARMIEGFDDPETHMAVLGQDGAVIAASGEFAGLEISPATAKALAEAASADRGRLIKRPIPTIKGYLPAAIGMPSDEPALFLLFTVDTTSHSVSNGPIPTTEEQPSDDSAGIRDDFADAIDAVAEIEEAPELEEEILLMVEEPVGEGDVPEAHAVATETVAEVSAPPEVLDPSADPIEDVVDGAVQAVDADAIEPAIDTAAPSTTEEAPDADPTPEPENAASDPVSADVNPTDEPVNATVEGFVFQRDARALRFVWKIDANGQFTEVSKEFATAVGPHAADVTGMAFSDLAALFHLDPDGKITELLNKRDTWSGKTIWWPVEGTSLNVPVDLAALPTYTRTREFDGFRGFGIVRIADAAEDPNAVGLSLLPQTQEDLVPETEGEARDSVDEEILIPDRESVDVLLDEQPPEQAAEDIVDLIEDRALEGGEPEHFEPEAPTSDIGDETTSGDAATGGDAAEPLDWPAGERPALRLVPTAGRRYSDKVIQLEERRSRLSPGEQAAFREIARQLDRFIGPDDQDGMESDEGMEPASEAEAELLEAASVVEAPEALPQDVEIVQEPELPAEEIEAAEEERDVSASAEDVVLDADQVETEEQAPEESTAQPEPAVTPEEAAMPADAAPEFHAANINEVPPADETEPDAAVDTEEEPPLSDRELLGQMIPIRERIGLSAEIIDQMPVALLVHNGDSLIHGNPEFLKLTGYQTIEELADVGGLDALLQRQDLEDKTSEASGMVVVRADDAIIPVSARLQSVRWDDATALMLALMPVAAAATPQSAGTEDEAGVIPLQPARQAGQLARLQVEVEELRAILETATDGVVIIDETGGIRSMNRAASGLFNYDNEEINGKPFVVLFAHESQRAILDYLSGLSGHGVASVLNDGREVIGREASGGFLPLFMTIGKLTSSNGYCAVIRDITQWKRTEEELRTAKRAAETANAHKSEFLAHVSHEIRTPLNAIIGFADMMASERFGPIGHPRYIEYANDINRSGRHVLDIVNDLLDISKIEAGEMEMDFIAVGLNETVSEAVSLVQPQANNQRVIIRTALSNAVPQVVADIRSIKQIVLNVLSNAIRFTPSGGQIVVSTAYEANGTVALRIRDTGIGMTRAELELAMKPFRQVAGTARKRGDGTGLGLPLTKAMVDANRASFAINSAPNEGTLVEITFPPQRVLAN
ncbi:PAS domain S-box protein [Neorhizobium lilium]|uniref:histidine kinase n=1 Tax=Neorhizobium lilium TaxID=2503024 RepID=A0A444LFT5_9HYPH|nr:ATP-binding protein [Neorhizobium lilium]RWX77057.1 PAS domain S-box protein [Neorhizobium lilium]